MRSLDSLFAAAESIIEKQSAFSKQASAEPVGTDQVEALAQELDKMANEAPVTTKQAMVKESNIKHAAEVIINAVAVLATKTCAPELNKVAEFKEKAKALGKSDEAIQAVIEKSAAGKALVRKLAPFAAGAATLGAAGSAGYMGGKKKGRNEAIDDINQILSMGYGE